jgi:hypothetical protein
VSIDVIERRRAVEQRLARARTVALSVEEATADIAAGAGRPIEDLDPHGSLRTALTALAGVAALRPEFDVLVALPDSPFALRVRYADEDVDIEVLQRQDDEPAASPAPAQTDQADGVDPIDGVDQAGAADQPGDSDGPGEGHVASDLAAMLWQTVNTAPS